MVQLFEILDQLKLDDEEENSTLEENSQQLLIQEPNINYASSNSQLEPENSSIEIHQKED